MAASESRLLVAAGMPPAGIALGSHRRRIPHGAGRHPGQRTALCLTENSSLMHALPTKSRLGGGLPEHQVIGPLQHPSPGVVAVC